VTVFAAGSILIGTGCIAAIQSIAGFPPLLLYVASVTAAALRMGLICGLLALLLATLASDFFFVDPILTFSLNERVLFLSLNYIVGGGIALLICDKVGRRRR
jgi:K+-sensing histidine kinase KdpD